MDYKEAAREWSRGTIRPIYVLYGAETWIMGEWMDLLVSSALDPETREFALSKYDLTETPIETVIEDAETLPFLSERKVVIAEGAHFLTGSRDPSRVDHRVEMLQHYVQQPAEHTTLVIAVAAEKLDERKTIVKTLKTSAVVLPFAPLGPSELAQWAAKKAAARGVTFAQGAVDALIARVGASCAALAGEIEKLSLYVGKGGEIALSHIEELTVRTTEHNVFLLVDEIAKLRPERAMTILHDLLKEKEEPIKLVALIARQFRMMLSVKALAEQGEPGSRIAARLGARPFAVKQAGELARRFRTETLERLLVELADLDYGMKTGTVDKTLGLELFILRLGVAAAGASAKSG